MLSFLIPVYNGIPHIRSALSSIVDAGRGCGFPLSVVISDNKSTDSSLVAIKDFIVAKDQNVACEIYEQGRNLGCYGNLAFLQGLCPSEWGYILCSDDTLRPEILESLTQELAAIGPTISMVAFEDQEIRKSRLEIKRLNGGNVVSGKKGIAFFFLYGCFIGGLSNVCIRSASFKTVRFDESFKYFGDIKFYVDLLASGGSIFLSGLETNLRREHANQISRTLGGDNSHFAESSQVVDQCIDCLSSSRRSRLILLAFAHSVLFYQFYRLAINRALAGDISAFGNLVKNHRGGFASAFACCFISCFMVVRPVREFLRRRCQSWIFESPC
jgi:glycosyltransferase involved in cell wall biosynthesis